MEEEERDGGGGARWRRRRRRSETEEEGRDGGGGARWRGGRRRGAQPGRPRSGGRVWSPVPDGFPTAGVESGVRRRLPGALPGVPEEGGPPKYRRRAPGGGGGGGRPAMAGAGPGAGAGPRRYAWRWAGAGAGGVRAEVREPRGGPPPARVRVRLEVEGAFGAVLWGVTRGDRARWHAPGPGAPAGGAPLPEGAPEGSTRSPLSPGAAPGAPASLDLELPGDLAPAFLAFTLEPAPEAPPARGGLEGPSLVGPPAGASGEAAFFTLPLGALPGRASPLGPSPAGAGGGGLNLAAAAPAGVSGARLRLARAGAPAGDAGVELELDPAHHRTGDVWHVLLPAGAAGPPLRYSFQFLSGVGPAASISAGWRPDPLAPLLCPLSRMSLWSEDPGAPGGAGGAYAVEDLAVYSLDCRGGGLSMHGAAGAGGVGEGGSLEELRAQGFTAVALRGAVAPGSLVAVSAEVCGEAASGAPPAGGSAEEALRELERPREELRGWVRRAGAAGLEVLLTLDCAEMAAAVTGADPAGVSDPGVWAGVLGDPRGAEMLALALAELSRSLGVSGFIFERAEALSRGSLSEQLAAEPVLRHLKLVASVNSRDELLRNLPTGAPRSVFPHWGAWAEVNWAFPDDLRAFLEGAPRAGLGSLATRLAGSADIFEEWQGGALATHVGRRPAFGFTPLEVPEEGAEAGEVQRAQTIQLAAAISPGVPFVSGRPPPPGGQTFLGALLALRAEYLHILQPLSFRAARDIRWHAPGGGEPAWDGEDAAGAAGEEGLEAGGAEVPAAGSFSPPERFLGISLWSADGAQSLYAAFNGADRAIAASPPALPPGRQWVQRADTAAAGTSLCGGIPVAPGAPVTVQPGSGVLLELSTTAP